MDALDMKELEDNSFDTVIDKGTFDALCCGSNYSVPVQLMKEMLRVCKIGGFVCLITHSGKESRGPILNTYFNEEDVEVHMIKTYLSEESNLINIMRSTKKSSLKEIIMDPVAMKQVMLKCKNTTDSNSLDKMG